MSHDQVGLGVSAVVKFCALGFHLKKHLFQKIGEDSFLKMWLYTEM